MLRRLQSNLDVDRAVTAFALGGFACSWIAQQACADQFSELLLARALRRSDVLPVDTLLCER
ncbi:MAG: hypothetical protein WDO74_31530 [Pseudomonadota bacterium]